MNNQDQNPIYIHPPQKESRTRRLLIPAVLFVITVTTALTGWVGGHLYSQFRRGKALEKLAHIPAGTATSDEQTIAALRRASQVAPEKLLLHMQLAWAYIKRAEFSEQPAPYLAEAVREAELYWLKFSKRVKSLDTTPEVKAAEFYGKHFRADIFAAAHKDSKAAKLYAELLKEEPVSLGQKLPSLSAQFFNSYAFFLLNCDNKKYRNPQLALELIKKCIRVPGSTKQPAFLDTLALAHLQNGSTKLAKEAQRLALARSKDSAGLHELIARWDSIENAAKQ